MKNNFILFLLKNMTNKIIRTIIIGKVNIMIMENIYMELILGKFRQNRIKYLGLIYLICWMYQEIK